MRRNRSGLLGLAVAATLALTGCGMFDLSATTTQKDTAKAGKIALLLPERAASRYDTADYPYFAQRVMQLCPDCTVDYYNATGDADVQAKQADDALAAGAKVLVMSSVDSRAGGRIVEKAAAKGVPTISYDRLVLGTKVDYYVSFDNAGVGKLQAEALLKALGTKASEGEILWVNGSPTDNNATLFKRGAHAGLDGKVKIAAESDTADWKPSNARAWADSVLPGMKGRKIIGAYAANDGTAGAVIAALKAAGYGQVPVTGQDAEIAALQRILTGDQYMTVYKAIRPEAEKAAELAVDLVRGKRQETSVTTDNQAGEVPSFLLQPLTVTKENMKDTVLADGFVTPSSLCAGEYSQACAAAGIG